MSEISTKTARVDFRIAADQKETIERAAALSGLNLSDFIVSTSLARATEVLQERTRITLSECDWQQFVNALEEERQPTEAAKKAADRYNSGWRDRTRYHW